MLTNPSYNEVTITTDKSITVNPNLGSTQNPNKRGCCQTKRRNYSLLTSSNGIENTTEKSCCSKDNEDISSSEKSCCSKEKQNKATVPKIRNKVEKAYTEYEIVSFKKEFDKNLTKGLIRTNKYLEVFDENSLRTYTNYSPNKIKAKLLNPDLKLDVVSVLNKNNNSINISIIDTNLEKKYLDQTFKFTDSETNITKYEESLSIITLSRWLSLQEEYSKSEIYPLKTEMKKEVATKEIKESECKEKYGIDSECMCINHDMGCSFVTSKSGNFQFWTPCAGNFEADVFDCCFNHDVGLWCTSDLISATFLGVDLVDCFEEKIIKEYLKQAGWFCEFFEFPILLTSILFLPLILSPIMGFGMGVFGSDKYRNKDGVNDRSCLCGGDLPTVCCKGTGGFEGVCLDGCCNEVELCSNTVDKKRGIGCKSKPKCGKKCAYSVHPNYYYPEIEKIVSTYHLTSKSSFYLGNDKSKTVAESECCSTNLPNECTDECFNCFYACKRDPNTGKYFWKNGKVLVDASFLGSQWHHLPCCPGTPNENENDRSNICATDRNGGGGSSLPICGSFLHIKNGGGPCIEENKGNSRSKNLVVSSQEVF